MRHTSTSNVLPAVAGRLATPAAPVVGVIFLRHRMLEKEDLISTTQVLNAYVAVDRETFKFSLSRIIPIPFLFTPVDYKSLHDDLLAAHNQILQLIDRRKSHGLSEKDKSTLFNYLVSLENAISKLLAILIKLDQESQSPFKYKYREYREDCREYRGLVNKYSNLGRELNQYV